MMTKLAAQLIAHDERQLELARELAIQKSHMSEFVNGRRAIPLRHVMNLCRRWECNPQDVVGWVYVDRLTV